MKWFIVVITLSISVGTCQAEDFRVDPQELELIVEDLRQFYEADSHPDPMIEHMERDAAEFLEIYSRGYND